MQIQAIRNDNVNFGHKLPNKRTYRAMQAYYELLNDKGSAVEFRMLDHEARARLHYMNFKKAESKIIDLAESSDKSIKLLKAGKLRFRAVYERLASMFYYVV